MVKQNVEVRIKIALLRGKRLTHAIAWRLYHTNRLAVYIDRLRKKGLKIKTMIVPYPEGRTCYGVYYLEPVKKVSRIKTTLK